MSSEIHKVLSPKSSLFSEKDQEIIELTYEILLPVISSVGIMGNSFIFLLLSQKKFNGFMFTYLKGLALTDLFYLFFCLQVNKIPMDF